MNVARLAAVASGVALRRVPAGLARGVARGARPVPPDLTHLVVVQCECGVFQCECDVFQCESYTWFSMKEVVFQ